jgi:hypothetical protein
MRAHKCFVNDKGVILPAGGLVQIVMSPLEEDLTKHAGRETEKIIRER